MSEQSDPLVSIIVPCYNYGHLLPDALDSVLVQSYKTWECIIVNDGSTDLTEEVAKDYKQKDQRFVYLHQPNTGLSEARNAGLKRATGQYIQLLDADDKLEFDKLLQHVTYLENNTDVDLVYGDVSIFNHQNQREKQRFNFQVQPASGNYKIVLPALIIDNFFLPGCPLFRKALIHQVGYFKRSLQALEDWHFWYRCALNGATFQYLPFEKSQLLSRSHGVNMSTDRKRMWLNKSTARMDIMKYSEDLTGSSSDEVLVTTLEKLKYKHYQHLYLDLLRYHLMFGSISTGITSALKYAVYSRRYYFAMYDSAYWVKERLRLKLLAS